LSFCPFGHESERNLCIVTLAQNMIVFCVLNATKQKREGVLRVKSPRLAVLRPTRQPNHQTRLLFNAKRIHTAVHPVPGKTEQSRCNRQNQV